VRGGNLQERGQAAFGAFARRSTDRRLERTVGSRPGLRIVFALMAHAFRPERAAGWSGDIRFELKGSDDVVRTWTVTCTATRARARAGAQPDPGLTIKLRLADFARLAAGQLHPVKALLTGRLDLEGDFDVAVRLGDMFGQPSAQ
jgi:putative sterol carrier protein